MNNSIIDFKNFPTTRYQGSKRKILPWIYENIKELKFESVLDAFGGTGSVSYLLKKMGKTVTYNDNLKFNHLIGKAIIENSSVKLSESDIKQLLEKKSDSAYTLVQDNFKDIYYYNYENHWIDNLIASISSMNSYSEEMLQYKRSIAYYALFQSCLIKRPFNLFHRKNLNLRDKEVERSFGNLSSWNKSFKEHFLNFSNEVNNLVFNNGKECRALNQSVFNFAENSFDLIYLDPPYFRKNSSNETSNYLRSYHFLEGIAKYSEWAGLIDSESINNRFKAELSANEINVENITESLENIFDRFKKSIIILSYKKNGIPSIDTLTRTLKKIKRNVYTKSMHYKYALNHQNGDASKNREILIIGL
ncbi:DNA adenine methylase [Dolichospermum sp. ST_sed3]|nr:DNA adenine methylase [Dolichospermum sp. ST_sed3]